MSQTSPCFFVASSEVVHKVFFLPSCTVNTVCGLTSQMAFSRIELKGLKSQNLLLCTCSRLRKVFWGGRLHRFCSALSSCSVYLWVVSSYEAISFWAQRVLAEERLKGSGTHSRTVISTDWSGVAQAPRLPHYSSRNTLNDKQGANVTLHLRLRSWMWINMKWWLDVDIQFDGGYTKRAGALDLFI